MASSEALYLNSPRRYHTDKALEPIWFKGLAY